MDYAFLKEIKWFKKIDIKLFIFMPKILKIKFW